MEDQTLQAKRVIKIYDKLMAKRKNWETYWEFAAQYVLPNRSDFITRRASGDMTRTNQIFDATATRAARLLATSIQGAIFTDRWFSLKMRNDTSQSDALNGWLEQVEAIMLAAFEESNFQVQIGQALMSMVVFGTSGLTVEGKSDDGTFQGLTFRDHELRSFVFDEDADGIPNRIYRKIVMSPESAILRYRKDEEVPASFIKYCEDLIKQNSENEIELVEAIEPAALLGDDTDTGFSSILVHRMTNTVIKEQAYEDLDFMVSRWDKITGDMYGWSPTLGALPDIITINEAKRLELGAWEKNILPPKQIVVGSMFSDEIDRSPNGITMVNRPDAITNIDEPYDFRVTIMKGDEIKEAIKYAFHEQELILPDRNHDTATEVSIRYDLMQRLLGATFGRIKSEMLQKLIASVFRIMQDQGAFPPPPEITGSGNLDVEYQSPLAKSQRASETQAVERLVSFAMQLAQINPELAMAIDFYEALNIYSQGLGARALILKDKETFDKAVQEMQKAQQEALQQERQHEQQLKGEPQNAATEEQL